MDVDAKMLRSGLCRRDLCIFVFLQFLFGWFELEGNTFQMLVCSAAGAASLVSSILKLYRGSAQTQRSLVKC